jgi:uncharacterized protein DUF6600
MKVLRILPWVTAMALVAGAYTPQASAKVDIGFSIGFSNFESSLSPHGNWFVSAQYGRVWQPSVYHAGWNPYYDGHWVYTDVGWTWVSDYRWGAIPYHYGTWALDPEVGWIWVPGDVWAPSWVVFREGPGYVGWAPVPVGYSVGASFTFGNHGYYDDYDPNIFVFVGDRDFLAPRIRERIVPVYQTRTIIQRTTVLNTVRVENNIVVNRGPSVRTIERSTGVRVQPERIERVERVAPMTRVTRDELRVDRTRAQSGPIRATAPVEQPRADAQQLPPRQRTERRFGQPVNPPDTDEQRAPAPQRIEPRRRGEPVPEPTPEPERRPTAQNVPPQRNAPPPTPEERRMARRNLPPRERRNQTEPSPPPVAKSKQPPPEEERQQIRRSLPPPPQPQSDPRTMAERERQRQQAGKAKRKAPPPKKKDKDEDKDNPTS